MTDKEQAVLKKYFEEVSKASEAEKNVMLANLMWQVQHIIEILKNSVKEKEFAKEIKEIENIISLGPKWLNFTRKVKKRKNRNQKYGSKNT